LKKVLGKIQDGEQSQRQVFHLLHEFALKICIRYSGIEDNPEELMYEGFAKFFKEWKHLKFKDVDFLKDQLRKFLISVCIEIKMNKTGFDISSWDCSSSLEEIILPINSHTLSNKDIVDVLRTIPFPFRAIYNMSVIERFSEKEISSTLSISEYAVQCGLRLSRKYLSELLMHSFFNKQSFATLEPN
jgi:DNA-directed RNA polymerase specialized sigma24 family protein